MTGLSLGLLASLQLLANLALQIVVFSVIGVGTTTDAYVAAQAVPAVLISVLAVSMNSIWQPRLSVLVNDREGWRALQGVAQGQALLLFGGPILILMLTAHLWVKWIFPGFNAEQLHSTAIVSRILLLACLLNGHAALLTTAQRSRDRFFGVEIVQLIGFAIALAVVVCTPRLTIEAVAWITAGRALLVCVALYVIAGRPGIEPLRAVQDRSLWSSTGMLLAGSSIYKTGPLVDRFWSSLAPAGSVTVFSLVQTGFGALATVLDRAICVPVTPRLARMAQAGDMAGMGRVYRRCVFQTLLLVAVVPILMLMARPIWAYLAVRILKVSPELAEQMWLMSYFLLGYLWVAGCGYAAMAGFYALGDTRTPVTIGLVGFLIGVVLKSVAFLTFGMSGLAIATSAYYVLNLIILIVLLEKRIRAEAS